MRGCSCCRVRFSDDGGRDGKRWMGRAKRNAGSPIPVCRVMRATCSDGAEAQYAAIAPYDLSLHAMQILESVLSKPRFDDCGDVVGISIHHHHMGVSVQTLVRQA